MIVNLGVQLYSARGVPSLEAQLEIVARNGFTCVETYEPLHADAALVRALLDRFGLRAKSGHFSLDWIENDPSRTLDAVRILGIETVVAPYLKPGERPTDRAGWLRLGVRLARARDAFAREGLGFAWHNHDFEFAALPDGSRPIEHLLGADVAWEADLAWAVRGGAVAGDWVARYAGRLPLVHVKDIALLGANANEDGWADVGEGVMPWRALWGRCVAAGAQTFIAEHDKPSDFDRFVRVSADAMRCLAEANEP